MQQKNRRERKGGQGGSKKEGGRIYRTQGTSSSEAVRIEKG